MGYTNDDTAKNKQDMFGATFLNVGEEGLDIQSITLIGDGANGGSWIKWWDSETSTYSAKAVYADPLCNPIDDEDLDYGGWGDQVDWYPIEKTFAPGQGFWFQAARDNVKLVLAGELLSVATETIARNTTKNKQDMFVNPFPVPLNLQSITLDGDGANGVSWIKWWDPDTATYSAKAVYCDPLCNPVDDEDLDYGGWGDQVDWYPIEKTFAPGQGFWFQAARDNVKILFPNPLAPAK